MKTFAVPDEPRPEALFLAALQEPRKPGEGNGNHAPIVQRNFHHFRRNRNRSRDLTLIYISGRMRHAMHPKACRYRHFSAFNPSSASSTSKSRSACKSGISCAMQYVPMIMSMVLRGVIPFARNAR